MQIYNGKLFTKYFFYSSVYPFGQASQVCTSSIEINPENELSVLAILVLYLPIFFLPAVCMYTYTTEIDRNETLAGARSTGREGIKTNPSCPLARAHVRAS